MKKFNTHFMIINILVLMLIAVMPIKIHAEDNQLTRRYFLTEDIPIEIEEYAQDVFAAINSNDLYVLDIDAPLNELKLSHGIKVDLIPRDYDKYFFFILCNNQVIATLVVNDVEDELLFALVKGEITDAIDCINSSINDPIKIIVLEESIYAVNNSGVNLLAKSPYVTAEKSNIIDLQNRAISTANTTVRAIDSSNVYNLNKDVPNERSIESRVLNVPLLDNPSVQGHGVCWASCTAAAIEYIEDGSSASINDAKAIREELLDIQITGGIGDAKSYIKSYTGRTLYRYYDALQWSMVKTQIRTKDNPCFMNLRSSSSTAYHATLLIGYAYENSDDTNRRIYLMDPNADDRVVMSYSTTYITEYNHTYIWMDSLYR